MIIAIITTLDNLPMLKEQCSILAQDTLIDKIVVVSNGSIDGTNDWLATQPNLTTVIKENDGAGPGRNAGIDAAGRFDYALFLDGGIRPLVGGTRRMLDYLESNPDADVIGVDYQGMVTDKDKAWRRWPEPITNGFRYSVLSLTAYCLTNAKAWDGLRFREEGPFGQPGWGVDDNEMACQWKDAGIVVHAVSNIAVYRRSSGSFQRLLKETGIWPNQYGSVYEARLVWLQQEMPQHKCGGQWGEPWLTIVLQSPTPQLIKKAHDEMRKRHFDPPWSGVSNPYSVVVWEPAENEVFFKWAEPRRLRQHHGDVILVDGNIVRRTVKNEATWTGDFRIWTGAGWRGGVRKTAHYYGLVKGRGELLTLIEKYDRIHEKHESMADKPQIEFTEL